MGISVSDVSYISSTEVFVHKIAAPVKLAVTSLRKVTGDADASATSTSTSAAATGHASARKEKVLVEYDTQVTTRTTVALSSTSYPTTAVLYDSLTSMLVTAVENGTYGAYLRTSGVPELVNAGASGASSSALQIISPTPSDSSGGNSSDALSAGAIAGIVIGAVGFVALCGALFYFLIVDGGACLGTAKRTAPGQNTRQADQTFVSNPLQSGMPTHKPPPVPI